MTYPMLAIDTTGIFASVALKDHDGNIYEENLTERLNHLKGLLPLVDSVLKSANIEINDVKNIAVSHGPGSFTGIRIGLSTVRSIAQITGAKVIGVPTQEAFVYNNPMYGGIVCPIFDARMEQMYAGAFILRETKIETLIKTDAYTPQEYLKKLAKIVDDSVKNMKTAPDFLFFGDGLPVFETRITHWAGLMQEDYFSDFSLEFESVNHLQKATSVLKWAENFGTPKDYTELFPVYIRKAEAQRRLDEKNGCSDDK